MKTTSFGGPAKFYGRHFGRANWYEVELRLERIQLLRLLDRALSMQLVIACIGT